MTLADVNVLVGAFRPDANGHAQCRRWLDATTTGVSPFAVSPQILSSVVRVATHPRVFPVATVLQDVLTYCDFLLTHPNARSVEPGDRHWSIFRGQCLAANARGNLVPDAWFAALAIEHGCEWITLDRDFARFPHLRWRLPG